MTSPAVLMPFVAHRVFGWTPVEIDASWGLRTIKPGMAYTVCNSLCCADCGFLFLDLRFSDHELNRLYDGYRDERYTALREFYEPGYRARNTSLNAGVNYVSQIEDFLKPHLTLPVRLLDWGGDTGKNSPFKNASSVFHIYDISAKPVISGATAIDRNTALASTYDLIVCGMVLEHVPYPADVILDLKNAMQADTLLYVEVPHEQLVRDTADARTLHLKKKHWHEHINFYTRDSLIALLGRCGLTVLDMRQLEARVDGNDIAMFQLACKLATPNPSPVNAD